MAFSRFLDKYYIFNLLLVGSYAGLRYFDYVKLDSIALQNTEMNLFGMLTLILSLRFVRAPTMDVFYADVIFFSKIALLAIIYLTEQYTFIVFYLPAVAMVTLMFDQPVFTGGGSSRLEWIAPQKFDSVMSPEKKDKDSTCKVKKSVVIFSATWNPLGKQLTPIFANLASAHKDVKFYRLDIGKAPALAERFRISLDGASKQLPTLICFEDGKEVGRAPRILKNDFIEAPQWNTSFLEDALHLK